MTCVSNQASLSIVPKAGPFPNLDSTPLAGRSKRSRVGRRSIILRPGFHLHETHAAGKARGRAGGPAAVAVR